MTGRVGRGRTIGEPLAARAHDRPDETALVVVEEDGGERPLSAAVLHGQAGRFAQALAAAGVERGDLVLIVLRHAAALPVAFWGTVYRGAIPSIYPYLTDRLDPAYYAEQVRHAAELAAARLVVTFPDFVEPLRRWLAGLGCPVRTADELLDGRGTGPPMVAAGEVSPEAIAVLQFSSGTTGLQKGVLLSHRAILNQVAAYGTALRLSATDVVVSWMPLYHDGGLVAGFLMPLLAGVPVVWMSPLHWVRAPGDMFRLIARHGGTLTWMPNFAFNHCVRAVRPRDLAGVDLGRWRVVNAAEPVRHESHRRFLERLGSNGVREDSLAVAYGMAENTLFVTATPFGEPPRVDWVDGPALRGTGVAVPRVGPTAVPVVSCGAPLAGAEIGVVDAAGRQLGERRVGEIVFRSDCLSSGYHRQPELGAQALRAGWFHSGDLGYVAAGQLYVTGRQKELIIVGGVNIYPQDLEAIANGVPGVHPGRTVAFGVFDEEAGTETVVLVCELDATGAGEPLAIEREVRRRIAQRTEVSATDVRLVDHRWLIKTSSGKIARAANREKYLREFRQDRVGSRPPPDPDR